ncbi:MAG: FliH/SctL family protein, partial [Pseudomonadota bacterium]
MSDHSEPILRDKEKAKKYTLPRFSEETPGPETKKYVFTPLAGGPQEVSLTYEEAEKIVARARSRAKAEAEGILKEAQKIRAAAREKGFEEGLNQGRDQGRQEVQQAFEDKMSSTLAVLQKISDLYEDLWQTNEALLVKLALKISERVVLHEVQTSAETIAETFKAALEHIGLQHRAVFRLNPQDLETLEAIRTELKESPAGL